MYSQNYEEEYIINYFGSVFNNGHQPWLLSIGENDGQTFSNSLRLIKNGWSAVLVEPSREAFEKMANLHQGNPNVICMNIAIANHDGVAEFFESGTHLGKGDTALLSTLDAREMGRWHGTNNQFKKTTVECRTYKTLRDIIIPSVPAFDFITIDAEGMDLDILKQIPLAPTRLVCIEYNNNHKVLEEIKNYCAHYGLNCIVHQNAENILIGRF